MSISYNVVQNIKNRLRIKTGEHNPSLMRSLAHEVERLDWVVACELRPASGSLVLTTSDLPRFDELDAALDQACSSYQAGIEHRAVVKRDDSVKRYEPAEEHLPGPVLAVTGILMIAVWISRLRSKGETVGIDKGFFNIASVTTAFLAYPILKTGIRKLEATGKLNMELLVCTASLASIIMRESATALVVMYLINLSEYLEDKTMEKTRKTIRTMLAVAGEEQMVWKIIDGREKEVPSSELIKDDLIVLRIGSAVPCDGMVTEGDALVDEASMTGESLPVYKKVDDRVMAGTHLDMGEITVRVEKIGDETRMGSIIKMIESEEALESEIMRMADKFADIVVPVSLSLFLITYFFTRSFRRAMSMLIIVCPCGVALSTPAAMTAAMGNAASRDILVRGGKYLEKAADVDTIVFDKTGTITSGTPRVSRIITIDPDITPERILQLAASSQEKWKHPLSLAVLTKVRECEIEIPSSLETELIIGHGIRAVIDDHQILVGSHHFMEDFKVDHEAGHEEEIRIQKKGEAVLFVAQDGKLIGLIGVEDKIRQDAVRTLDKLKAKGVNNIFMLTGDNEFNARAVAQRLPLTDIGWSMLPEDKAEFIREFKAKHPQSTVAMVGDGINDTPAFTCADLSFVMGTAGADAALEHADIVLKKDELDLVCQAVTLGKKTVETIHQNYGISIFLNLVGVVLAGFALISPFTGALIHNGITLYVVTNSGKLIFYEP
ncbi:MAG: heavy metal translocating P-type ATPase [Deltaproteobacteria bacterium]|jgi:heavy metal translocating P-type ATPase|nr:heavy metal translocating P-type ATPase [Deltaproteobacteria bacterium]